MLTVLSLFRHVLSTFVRYVFIRLRKSHIYFCIYEFFTSVEDFSKPFMLRVLEHEV